MRSKNIVLKNKTAKFAVLFFYIFNYKLFKINFFAVAAVRI